MSESGSESSNIRNTPAEIDLPDDISEFKFRALTGTGVEFRVVKGEFYRRGTHDKANTAYLDTILTVGRLGGATYHGHVVPLVGVRNGVVKLKEIEIGGRRLKKAGEISAALGILKHHDNPIELDRL